MARPRFTIDIEPNVGGIIRYLTLAPSSPNEGERFQLSFEATFTNREPRAVHLTELEVSFPDAPNVKGKDIHLKTLNADETVTEGLDLSAAGDPAGGDTRAPMDFKEVHNIILTSTPPSTIRFELFSDEFDLPARHTFLLARHESPVAGGAYIWMAKAQDLWRGEYWTGTGAAHCCGHQLYAHDFGVEFFDKSENRWTALLPGTRNQERKNDHYRIWGKRVYAMADGVVLDFDNHFHDNLVLGKLPDNPPSAFGNHFTLRHGTEKMVYAHFQQLSLNPALMQREPDGDAVPLPVKAGDFLGLVGNSGNSSNPHLHIHCVDEANGKLRPIPWQQKMVARKDSTTFFDQGVWRQSQQQGLPVVTTMIFPGDTPPADDREWSNWEWLGGELLSGPAVCSRAPNRLDVFGVGLDRALWHKWWNGNRWSEWENLGGQLESTPAAVSWAPNRIDVFGRRATDNSLYHKWWDGSRWHAWESLGGTLLSGPTVSSRGLDRLDVFGREATDSSLCHKWWDGSRWHNWENLGGKLSASPAAVSWSSSRIDVFGRWTDNTLWQQWWNGSSWSGWQPHGRQMWFGPGVCSRRANSLDVFVVSPDGTLQHMIWNGSEWTHWENLGGHLTTNPAAVSWSGNRIDVFGRGLDTALYHTFWEPS
jgi:hypothetical protein